MEFEIAKHENYWRFGFGIDRYGIDISLWNVTIYIWRGKINQSSPEEK